MSKMDHAQITAKCVETSKCLINKEAGLHDYDLDVTRSIGDIARLAVNIRQAGSFDLQKLASISAAIKQNFTTVRSDSLSTLEELGWVETYKEGTKIKRIDESIPPLEDILASLGELWEDKSPTEVDIATVQSLSFLTKKPATKEALISEIGVSDEPFENALNYGVQTNYFGTFESFETGKEVVWTPFYWAGKLEDVQKFLQRQSDEKFNKIGILAKELSKYPGRPLENIKTEPALLNGGVASGFFPSVGVNDREGAEHEYVFSATPQFELDPEKDIFEKARLIVGCIRHGQYHAEVSKIKYPVLLLRSLREGRIKPHSYAKLQYALLYLNNICTYEKSEAYGVTAYKPLFNDTPENRVYMDVAEEMLKGEEPVHGTVDEPEVQELLTRGVFNYSSEQRYIKSAGKIVATDQFERMIEAMQSSGVYS